MNEFYIKDLIEDIVQELFRKVPALEALPVRGKADARDICSEIINYRMRYLERVLLAKEEDIKDTIESLMEKLRDLQNIVNKAFNITPSDKANS